MKFCAILVLFLVGLLMSAEAGRLKNNCKNYMEAILGKIGEMKREENVGPVCKDYMIDEKPADMIQTFQRMNNMCRKFNAAENKQAVHECIKDVAQQVIDGMELSAACETQLWDMTENFCKRGGRRRN